MGESRRSHEVKLDLNGHLLTVDGKQGISSDHNGWYKIVGGVITSNSSFIELRNSSGIEPESYMTTEIESVISDNGMHKVGLRIGYPGEISYTIFHLTGTKANTFTGDVEINAKKASLYLNKAEGVVAIQGDLKIKHGTVSIGSSGSLSSKSTIYLGGNGESMIHIGGVNKITSQYLKLLKVDGYNSYIAFRVGGVSHLYLDDIVIDGFLDVMQWNSQIGGIYIKKTSTHLDDALNKVRFSGYETKGNGLTSFDEDYFLLAPLRVPVPEPSTYGAILSAMGLGVWAWRRRISKEFPTS